MTKLSPREKVLAERGLVQRQPAKRKTRRIVPDIKVPKSRFRKTALMKYLEAKYGVVLEYILTTGSLSVVAKKLGNEVDVSTLSKWIKRFKLRYTADNLPDCQMCRQKGPACEAGICYVLLELGLYELVELKKQEVLNEGSPTTNEGA